MISDESIQELLLDADRIAVRPPVLNVETVIATVRYRLTRQKNRRVLLAGCSSIAAVILIVGLIWIQHDRNKQFQIAQLQDKIEALNQRLDKTMAMIQKTMVAQRQQEKLEQLEKQLVQYGDFDKKLQAQEENTALIILIQADRLQNANLLKDAQAFYGRVVELYPNTYWAQIARQKLQSVQPPNKNGTKGDTL